MIPSVLLLICLTVSFTCNITMLINAFKQIPKKSTIFQFGNTAYVHMSKADKLAVITLDSDKKLTKKESRQIIADVERCVKEGRAYAKKDKQARQQEGGHTGRHL